METICGKNEKEKGKINAMTARLGSVSRIAYSLSSFKIRIQIFFSSKL